jgi:uncharacterized membrane protein
LKEDQHEYEQDGEYKGLSSKHLGIAIVLIAIVTFAVIIAFQQNPGHNATVANQEGDNLVIKVTDVKSDAKFYYYEVSDVRIRFFTVMGYDNQPHIAFDACDVCFESNRGYAHADPYMQCRECKKTFLVDGIGTENLSSGCWPSYLPVTITDGKILIKIDDVTQKQYMFE